MTEDVVSPSIGEDIQIGEDIKSFSIRLDDTLIETLRMQKVPAFHLVVDVLVLDCASRLKTTTSDD